MKNNNQNNWKELAFSEEFWDTAWSLSKKRSHMIGKTVSSVKYWNEMSHMYLDVVRHSTEAIAVIVKFLFQQKIFKQGNWVLDIGCGPGNFALSMERKGVHVIAIDPAFNMLKILHSNIKQKTNIYPICQKYEDFSLSRPCNIAFSAFCPAIHDRESLLHMEKMAEDFCVLILPGDHQSNLRKKIWRKIEGKKMSEKPFYSPLICPLNILNILGRQPNLQHLNFPSRKRSSPCCKRRRRDASKLERSIFLEMAPMISLVILEMINISKLYKGSIFSPISSYIESSYLSSA